MKTTEMDFMHTEIESSVKTTHRGTRVVPSKQTERPANVTPESARQQSKVAYIMSRFPKITETFVLYEMLALEKQGVQVEVYPLQRERTEVMHPEAMPFVAR